MNITKENLLLYAVTGGERTNAEPLCMRVEKAVKGGATCVQLREKHLSGDELLKEACAIREICRAHNVPLIINDNVEIALKADADGVHLGQGDMEATEARKILGANKIIGVSAHNPVQAIHAEKSGADYLGAGAAFATGSKSDTSVISHETLRAICESVRIPVVAIGGINAENIFELAGCGIAGVAVISAVFSKTDITSAAAKMLSCVREIVK